MDNKLWYLICKDPHNLKTRLVTWPQKNALPYKFGNFFTLAATPSHPASK
jgi:hypothetical protein